MKKLIIVSLAIFSLVNNGFSNEGACTFSVNKHDDSEIEVCHHHFSLYENECFILTLDKAKSTKHGIKRIYTRKLSHDMYVARLLDGANTLKLSVRPRPKGGGIYTIIRNSLGTCFEK